MDFGSPSSAVKENPTCTKGQYIPMPAMSMLRGEKTRLESSAMDVKRNAAAEPLVSIVDDDISVRGSTLRLLASSGLRVEAFESAEAFLKSGRLDETRCLVLDLSMPGIGGLGLQRHLAETGWRTPIVFLTARASEEEERRAMLAGATRFLRKPVDKETLLQAIHAALGSGPG
jgi:FixJ family two-component response regulator